VKISILSFEMEAYAHSSLHGCDDMELRVREPEHAVYLRYGDDCSGDVVKGMKHDVDGS
jgi:hypothetical protein